MFCSCGSTAKKYGQYCPKPAEQRWRCVECGRIFRHDRKLSGNHFVPGPVRAHLKRLLVAGVPKRAATRQLGISLQTVTRYYDLWKVSAKCPCGQRSTHQGFCAWRVAMCPKRQAWLTERWEKRSQTDIARLVREATASAEAHNHRIGTWVWAAEGDAGLWPYTKCLICGAGLTISAVPGFQEAPHISGKALTVSCETPEQREGKRHFNQEKRSWQDGKRTLLQLRRTLRDPSRSRSAGSIPEPTSRR